MEEVPFEVTEEIVIEDLTDVKEQPRIVPVSSNVKVRINKASMRDSKDKDTSYLNLELRIVDGVEVLNDKTGETEIKFQNKPLFTPLNPLDGIIVKADLSVKGRSEKNWWTNKGYLINLKKFCLAVDVDVKSIKINDEFFAELIGKELLVDVKHDPVQAKNSTGAYVDTGDFREKVCNWKKVE